MNSEERPADRSAIASVVAYLISAWRSGDGTAWGSRFTQDADFTTWFGLRMTGREAISAGHQEIFDSFYADTVYDLSVEFIRFLNDETAVVGLAGSVTEQGSESPATPQTVPLAVMVKRPGGWEIAAFQNTYAGEVEARRRHGDVRGGA